MVSSGYMGKLLETWSIRIWSESVKLEKVGTFWILDFLAKVSTVLARSYKILKIGRYPGC